MTQFTTSIVAPARRAETMRLILDLSEWPMFRGVGPVPGIVEATWLDEGGPRVGARVRVRNSDGSTHTEKIVEYEPEQRLVIQMELTPPASRVIETIIESVDLEDHRDGTLIRRTFEVRPRSLLAVPLIVIVAKLFLRRAVENHNRIVAETLASAASHATSREGAY